MNRLFKVSSLSFLALAFCFTIALSVGFSGGKAEPKPQLPSGNWTLSTHPYRGAGYDSLPVGVISVTSNAKGNIIGVGLRNRSASPVAAVKLSWVLTDKQNASVLLQGETDFIQIAGGLPAHEKRQVEFPVFSFARSVRPLVRDGALSGDFRVDVAVSEARYDDETGWLWKGPSEAVFVKAVSGVSSLNKCPNQKCSLTGGAYECQTSLGEYCTNHVSTCTNTICE
jgi:hypothetical protein